MKFDIRYSLIFLVATAMTFKSQAQLAVTTIDATSITINSADLNGSVDVDGSNSTDYYFEYGTSAGSLSSSTTPVNTTADGIVQESLTGLSAATQYFFRLYAEEEILPVFNNSSGDIKSFWTLSQVTSTAIANFQRQSATNNSITLEWDEEATNVSGYLIVYEAGGTAPNQASLTPGVAPSALTYTNKVVVMGSANTSTTITGLSANTAYSFRIIPFNAGADDATTNYKPAGNTTLSTFTLANVTALAIPDLAIKSQTNTSIELEWTAETTANDGYLIYYATGATAPDAAANVTTGILPASQSFINKIVKTGSSSTSQDITGLTPGTEYSFTVIPYNTGSDDATTNYNVSTNSTISAYTLATEPTDDAGTPTFVSSSTNSITLEFAKSNGANPANGYLITYRTGTAAPGNPSGGIDGTDGTAEASESDTDGVITIFSTADPVTATITGLNTKTEYSFRIMAFAHDGTEESTSFNYKTNGIQFENGNYFTLADEPASAVANFQKTTATETTIDFSFDAYTFPNAGVDNGGFIMYYQVGASLPDLSSLVDGTDPPNQPTIALDYAIQTTDAATTISTDGNISAGNQYSFALVPYNYDNSNFETFNYRKSDAITLSTWSLAAAASGGSVASSGYIIDNPTSASLDVTYTAVTGANGYLILYKEGSTAAFDISAVADGKSPTTISTALATGVTLFDNLTALTKTITALSGDTDYAFYVIPYTFVNSSGAVAATYNYNTASPVLKTGKTLCSTGPSVASAAISNDAGATSTSTIKMDISNVPAGAENLVIARLDASAAIAPIDGTTYAANASFGTGPTTGTGNDVVLSGTSTTVSTSDLAAFTDYAFDYYIYNPNGECYTFVATEIVKTDCEPASTIVSAASATTIATNEATLEWTITGAGNNVLIVARATSVAAVAPSLNVSYTANPAYLSGQITGTANYVVYDGNGSTVEVTALDALTEYTFDIYEYNPSGYCYNSTAESVAITTICQAPTTQATFNSYTAATDQTATTATISFSTVASADRYLVLAKEAGSVAFTPTNGEDYEAEDNLNFLLATDKGSGDKVIYAGSHPGAALSISNLSPSTNYEFIIYAYNDLNDCYNLTSPDVLTITTNAPSAANTLSIVSEAATINSVLNDENNSFITVLSFNMTDAGIDKANTELTGLSISAGASDYFASNGINWSDIIASAQLVNTSTSSNVTLPLSIATTGNSMSVSVATNENNNANQFGFIADAGTINMQLQLKLKDNITATAIDGKPFSFEVDPANITVEPNSSSFSTTAGTTITTSASNNIINVQASKFTFTSQPPATANAGENISPQPIFEARDVNNNIDLDFSSAFVVSNAATIPMENAPTTGFVNGVLTFPADFNYQGSGDGTLTVTAGAVVGTSNSVTIVPSVTLSDLSNGLNNGVLQSGTTNQAVAGLSIEVLGSNTLNQIVVDISATTVGKVTNPRLFVSANNIYEGVGVETDITNSLTVDNPGGSITFGGLTQGFAIETKFYFVVVDVESTVNAFDTPGLTFSLDQAALSYASTINKIAYTDSKAYTFEDIIKPNVNALVESASIISDSEVGSSAITLTISYGEEMDPSVNPTIAFPTTGEMPTSSLTFDNVNSAWSAGNTVFTAFYSLSDQNIEMDAIDVRVSNAQDKSGNVQNIFDKSNVFSIDTKNPTVGLGLGVTTITRTNNTTVLTATFSEAMDPLKIPDFVVNGTTNMSLSGVGAWTVGNTVYKQSFIHNLTEEELTAVDISISAAEDVNGNILVNNSSGNIVVDTKRPRITNITSPNSNGLKKPGDVISITVTFDEFIQVGGAPTLSLDVGTTAIFQSVSGSTATFVYTVGIAGSGQNTNDLAVTSVNLNGGSIQDLKANAGVLSLPASPNLLEDNKDIIVDTQPATISNVRAITADGFYKAGDEINIEVIFNELVFVNGFPTLSLNSGGIATYVSGTGSTKLVFTYTVSAGENVADLDYQTTNSLILGTGVTIKDQALINANINLPSVSGPNSLAANTDITIDTTDPLLGTPGFDPVNNSLNVSQTYTFEIQFNEIVSGAGTNNVRLVEVGTNNVIATFDGSSLFRNSLSTNLEFVNIDASIADSTAYYFELDAGAILDRAGNTYAGFTGSSLWSFTSAGPARITSFSDGACIGENFVLLGKYFSGVSEVVIGTATNSTTYNSTEFTIDSDEQITFNVKANTEAGNITLKKMAGENGNTRDFESSTITTIKVGPSSAQLVLVANQFICSDPFGGAPSFAEIRIDVVGGSGTYRLVYNNGEEDVEVNPYQTGQVLEVGHSTAGVFNYTIVSVTDTDLALSTCPSAPDLGTPISIEQFERSTVEAGGAFADAETGFGVIEICAANTDIVDFSDPSIVGNIASISGNVTTGIWSIVGGAASSGGFNLSKSQKTTTTIQPIYYISLDDAIRGEVELLLTSSDPGGSNPCAPASDRVYIRFVNTLQASPALSSIQVCKTFNNGVEQSITQLDAILADGTSAIAWTRPTDAETALHDGSWGFADTEDATVFSLNTSNPQAFYKATPQELENNFARLLLQATAGDCGSPPDPTTLDITINNVPAPSKSTGAGVNPQEVCSDATNVFYSMVSNASNPKFIWSLSNSGVDNVNENNKNSITTNAIDGFYGKSISINFRAALEETKDTLIVQEIRNGCLSKPDTFFILLKPTPTASIIQGPPITINNNTTNFELLGVGGYSGNLQAGGVFTGKGVVLTSDGRYLLNTTNLEATDITNSADDYILTYTYTTELGCSKSETQRFDVFDADNIFPLLGQDYCESDEAFTISVDNAVLPENFIVTDIFGPGITFTGEEEVPLSDTTFITVYTAIFNPQEGLEANSLLNASNREVLSIGYSTRDTVSNVSNEEAGLQSVIVYALPETNPIGLGANQTFCATDDDITLSKGINNPNDAYSYELVTADLPADLLTLNESGTYNFSPAALYDTLFNNNIEAITIDIRYSYADENGCSQISMLSTTVFRQPAPVDFNQFDYCVLNGVVPEAVVSNPSASEGDLIWYNNASLTTELSRGSNFTPSLADFGNNSALNLYVVRATGSCSSVPTEITFRRQQSPMSFSWNTSINDADGITFTGNTNNQAAIDSLIWSIRKKGEPELLALVAFPASELSFNYNFGAHGAGIYEITLSLLSSFGCVTSLTEEAIILEKTQKANRYTYNFNTEGQAWIAVGENSSWERAVPEEGTQFENSSAMWVTNAAGDYNVDEKSYIYSPAFDLSSIQKPSLSFDLWLNTVEGSDGLVIEYSTDQSQTIENRTDWTIIGQIGSGLNWLNNSGLQNTTSIQLGWSGAFSEELTTNTNTIRLSKNAKNELYELLESSQITEVVFRFKFESSSAVPATGVGIDNFTLESLNRTLLVEYFGDNVEDTDRTEMQGLQSNTDETASYAWINYRINEEDPLYDLASSEIVSREFFYEAFTAQNNFSLDGKYYDALFSNSSNELSKRALVSSQFLLTVSTIEQASSLQITVDVSSNEAISFPENTRLMLAVLNDSIHLEGNNYYNVLQRYLPSEQGLAIDQVGTHTFDYVPSTNFGSENLVVVAFLQSFDPAGDKEIYQTAMLKGLPDLDFADITANNIALLEDVLIYPNPANEVINISTKPLESAVKIKLYDLYGRQVVEKHMRKGSTDFVIETRNLATGMYQLWISNEAGQSASLKVVVRH